MKDLDFYFNTPDEHFNHYADNWYFQFKGTNKPNSDKSFEAFIPALHDAYFFVITNPTKPIACVQKLKEACQVSELTLGETVILIDKLLEVIRNHPDPDRFQRVFIHILDYRHDLSPIDKDPEFLRHKFEFDFDLVKSELGKIEGYDNKLKFMIETLLDFKNKSFEMDDFDLQYYEDTEFVESCVNEIARVSRQHHRAKKEIESSQERNKELIKETLKIIGALNFEKACEIICSGISSRKRETLERLREVDMSDEDRTELLGYEGLSKEEVFRKCWQKIGEHRDRLLGAYDELFKTYEIQTPDPNFNKDLSKEGVCTYVQENESHYRTLRQHPSEWNNLHLFGQLWGYANLVRRWGNGEGNQKTKKEIIKNDFTHREYILKHKFMVEASLSEPLTAKEMKAISSKRYEAFLSLVPKSKTTRYREPTRTELENVIQLLASQPKAKKLAEKALRSLK